MAQRLALICLLMSMIILLFPLALAESGNLHQLEIKSFEIREAKDNIQQDYRKACWYKVSIGTSCKSPAKMEDTLSILFGDAKGNQVYVPNLNRHVPPFNICSVNKFNILRPCADEEICYLFLKRDGMYSPNWMPAWVKVSQNNVLSRFGYGKFLPNHKWCGSSRCPRVSSGSTNATDFATRDVYRCFPQKM